MPELPEITNIARQMNKHLPGRAFAGFEIFQPKSLNLPPEAFSSALTGAEILRVSNRGKWILAETTGGWLLLNLGMGGEIFLTERDRLPEKHRLIFDLTGGSCLSINFWWFGYAHYAPSEGLDRHEMVSKLGPNVLDLGTEDFCRLLAGRRGTIKSFLLDQSRVAGIGNFYIHDILFLARLHPLRKIDSLAGEELEALVRGIRSVLGSSLEKGGAFYEQDLFGNKGGYTSEDIIIGYREGQPCPNCGTPVQKIKTGGTSSFICPVCQPL